MNGHSSFPKSFALGFALLASFLSCSLALSASPLVSMGPYDNFSTEQIDPAKWSTLEIVREIQALPDILEGGGLVFTHRAATRPAGATSSSEAIASSLQEFNPSKRKRDRTGAMSPQDSTCHVRPKETFYCDSTSSKTPGVRSGTWWRFPTSTRGHSASGLSTPRGNTSTPEAGPS